MTHYCSALIKDKIAINIISLKNDTIQKKYKDFFMPPNLDTSSTNINMLLILVVFAIFFFVLKGKKKDKDTK